MQYLIEVDQQWRSELGLVPTSLQQEAIGGKTPRNISRSRYFSLSVSPSLNMNRISNACTVDMCKRESGKLSGENYNKGKWAEINNSREINRKAFAFLISNCYF